MIINAVIMNMYLLKKSEQADETAVEEKYEPVNEVEQADEDEERFSIVKSSCGYVTYLDGNPIMASRTLKDAETIKKHFLKDVRKHKSRDKPP